MANNVQVLLKAFGAGKVQSDLKKIGGSFKVLGSNVSQLRRNLFNLRTSLLALGMAKVAKDISMLGVGFERSMNIVKAVSRSTADEFVSLTGIARKMGSETEFTAKQSADALTFLAMAGLSAVEQIKALPQTLDLATAAQMDLAQAADISTNIMGQMELQVEELTRVNDALVAVQSTANTNVEQAAYAFTYAGTTANAMKVDVEELSAMIGMLANEGVRGTMAGRLLRMSILQLIKPGDEAREVLKKYNIAVEDGEGGVRRFTDILYDLADANLTVLDRAKLFNSQTQNINILLKQGAPAIEEYVKKLKSMKGVSKEIADVLRNDMRGQLDKLKSAMQDLGLNVYATYRSQLDDMVQSLIALANKTADWVRENQALINQRLETLFIGISNSIEGISPLIEDIWEALRTMWNGFLSLPTWVKEIGLVGALIGGRKGKLLLGGVAYFANDLKKVVADYTAMNKMRELWDKGLVDKKETFKRFGGNQVTPENARSYMKEMFDAGALSQEFLEGTGIAFPKKPIFGGAQLPKIKGREHEAGSNRVPYPHTERKTGAAVVKDADEIKREKNEAIGAYEEIKFFAQDYHLFRQKQLDEYAEKMRQAGISEIDITRWKTEEIKKLQREQYEYQLEFADNYSTALQAKFAIMSDEVGNKFQQMAEMIGTVFENLKTNLSDFFFDAMRGELKSISDYVTSFLRSVQREMANLMAQDMTSSIISAGSSLLGFHSGGAVVRHQGGLIPAFHGGGMLASDERLAINKVGERYITREQNDWLTRISRQAGGGAGVNVEFNLSNESGTPLKAEQSGSSFEMDRYIIGVVLKSAQENGPIRQMIQGNR